MGTLDIRTDQENMGSWPNFKKKWRTATTGIAAEIESSVNNIVAAQITDGTITGTKLVDPTPYTSGIYPGKIAVFDFDLSAGLAVGATQYVDLSLERYSFLLNIVVHCQTTCTSDAADTGTLTITGGSGNTVVGAVAIADAADPWNSLARPKRPEEMNSSSWLDAIRLNVDTSGKLGVTAGVANITAGRFQVIGTLLDGDWNT